jgi:hypothetical protein
MKKYHSYKYLFFALVIFFISRSISHFKYFEDIHKYYLQYYLFLPVQFLMFYFYILHFTKGYSNYKIVLSVVLFQIIIGFIIFLLK